MSLAMSRAASHYSRCFHHSHSMRQEEYAIYDSFFHIVGIYSYITEVDEHVGTLISIDQQVRLCPCMINLQASANESHLQY